MRKLTSRVCAVACSHYNIELCTPAVVLVDTDKFTARSVRQDKGKRGIHYHIYYSQQYELSLDTVIHEVAHIIGWTVSDLNAAGHNKAYMDIYYTLTDLLKELK